jgi:hypothetical protein
MLVMEAFGIALSEADKAAATADNKECKGGEADVSVGSDSAAVDIVAVGAAAAAGVVIEW